MLPATTCNCHKVLLEIHALQWKRTPVLHLAHNSRKTCSVSPSPFTLSGISDVRLTLKWWQYKWNAFSSYIQSTITLPHIISWKPMRNICFLYRRQTNAIKIQRYICSYTHELSPLRCAPPQALCLSLQQQSAVTCSTTKPKAYCTFAPSFACSSRSVIRSSSATAKLAFNLASTDWNFAFSSGTRKRRVKCEVRLHKRRQ